MCASVSCDRVVEVGHALPQRTRQFQGECRRAVTVDLHGLQVGTAQVPTDDRLTRQHAVAPHRPRRCATRWEARATARVVVEQREHPRRGVCADRLAQPDVRSREAWIHFQHHGSAFGQDEVDADVAPQVRQSLGDRLCQAREGRLPRCQTVYGTAVELEQPVVSRDTLAIHRENHGMRVAHEQRKARRLALDEGLQHRPRVAAAGVPVDERGLDVGMDPRVGTPCAVIGLHDRGTRKGRHGPRGIEDRHGRHAASGERGRRARLARRHRDGCRATAEKTAAPPLHVCREPFEDAVGLGGNDPGCMRGLDAVAKAAHDLAGIAWHMDFDARRQRCRPRIPGRDHFDPGHVLQVAQQGTHDEFPFVRQGGGQRPAGETTARDKFMDEYPHRSRANHSCHRLERPARGACPPGRAHQLSAAPFVARGR